MPIHIPGLARVKCRMRYVRYSRCLGTHHVQLLLEITNWEPCVEVERDTRLLIKRPLPDVLDKTVDVAKEQLASESFGIALQRVVVREEIDAHRGL